MNFISYAISFFWFGAMLVNLHNRWHYVSIVTNGVVWWNIIMLFFSTLIPYVTNFAGSSPVTRTIKNGAVALLQQPSYSALIRLLTLG